MELENKSPTRKFVEVPEEELKQAVIEMCEKLGISTSAFGYNLVGTIIEIQRDVREVETKQKKALQQK